MKITMRTVAVAIVSAATMVGVGVTAAPAASASSVASYTVCNTVHSYIGAFGSGYRALAPHASGEASYKSCYLAQGDRGAGVSELQRAVTRCYGIALAADGIFGPRTSAALREVQRAAGAYVDGEFGPNTKAKMKFRTYRDSDSRLIGCSKLVS